MEKKLSARQLNDARGRLKQEMYRRDIKGELSPELKKSLNEKMDELNDAIGREAELERGVNDPKRIKGVTEKIDTKTPYMKQVSGDEFKANIANKRAALKKMGGAGKKMRSMIPGLGLGLAAMNIFSAPSAQAGEVAKEEAVQAVTDLVPGGVDELGPQAGTPESIIEDPTASPEMRRKALEALRNRNQ